MKELVEKDFNLKIYPNPTDDQQVLVVTTGKPRQLDISLYDISGRLVQSVYAGKTIPGENVLNVNLNHLRNGVYIYRVDTGDDIRHLKIVKN